VLKLEGIGCQVRDRGRQQQHHHQRRGSHGHHAGLEGEHGAKKRRRILEGQCAKEHPPDNHQHEHPSLLQHSW
jgi:hypothetical protein